MRRNAMDLPAPWSGADGPTPAQQLARSTFRLAVTARDSARFKPPTRSLWTAVTRASGKDGARERRAQLTRAVEDALATARAADPIDEQVAHLFLAKLAAPADPKAIDAELRDRPPRCHRERTRDPRQGVARGDDRAGRGPVSGAVRRRPGHRSDA